MPVDVKSLEFKITDEWKKIFLKNPWISFIPEFAEIDGQKFMKPAGRNIIYKLIREKDGKQEYVCHACSSDIHAVEVAHSDSKGHKYYQTVPYCPKCEEKPDTNGSSIPPKS